MRYFRTHYDNLKVSQDAPPEVIRMAYKALVTKYHPDRNPNCEKSLRAIQAINASYEILRDPERRLQHDKWISEQDEKYRNDDRKSSHRSEADNVFTRKTQQPPSSPPPTERQTSQKPNSRSHPAGRGCLGVLAVGTFIVIISMWSKCTSNTPYSNPHTPAYTTPTNTPLYKPTPTPFNHPAVSPPKNGEMVVKANYTLVAPFEIQSHAGSDYFVKLTDADTGQDAMTIFVKGGQTVDTRAPLGRFVVKYASGNVWYGYEHLFGPITSYSKADEIFEFKRTISSSAQSRLFDLQRKLSISDADFRSFLTQRGMSEKQVSFIFEGVDSETGESGVSRLPSSYWKKLISRLTNVSLHNEVVDRLNSRNQISNQIIRLRNEEESIEGFTITLYKVENGNLRTSEIDPEEF